MNTILKRNSDIKNKKVNKILLLYVFLLIPFFRASYLDRYTVINRIYDILFIASGFLTFFTCIFKKCISKFSIFTLVYVLFLSVVTFFCKEVDKTFIRTMGTIFLSTLLINYGTKYNCKDFLRAVIIVTSVLIWGNFITIIMYPDGMYHNGVSGMSQNFLLGIDNIHIVYFLCFWICYCTYINIYNKKNIFCSLTTLISILSLIMRWSATSLVGAIIIGIYFLFFNCFSKIKLLNVKTYIITYIIAYFGIICFKLQNLFSFVIVNVLKKDLTFTKRTKIWEMTIKLIKEKPIFGHGLVRYNVRNLTTGVSHSHNFFLEILYQGGFVLLAISLLLIGSVLKKLKDYYNYNLAKKLSVFIFALFVMMLTEFYPIDYTVFILALCYAIGNYVIEIKNQKDKSLIKNNRVVIIGGNHHNTLGVIRMLGEKNILPNLIITSENKHCYVTKSKYVEGFDIVKENEASIKKVLKDKYSNKKEKVILIPTSDFAELFIDKNLNELQKNFIVPNIDDKQGEIERLMNKFNQYELALQNHIKMAKTLMLNLYDKQNLCEIPFPCILKPATSALGLKSDIVICKNKQEFEDAIEVLKRKKYEEILVQELLDYDYEYSLIGCTYKDKMVTPVMIKKERLYPSKKGSTSYGRVINCANLKIKDILKFLRNINYNGIFDVDIFEKDKEIYLNEINFRNGANSYTTTFQDTNIIWLYLLMINDVDMSDIKKEINRGYYFQEDISDFKLVLQGQITLGEYIKSFKTAKVHLYFNNNDMKPFFYKFIYAILKKDNKQ